MAYTPPTAAELAAATARDATEPYRPLVQENAPAAGWTTITYPDGKRAVLAPLARAVPAGRGRLLEQGGRDG